MKQFLLFTKRWIVSHYKNIIYSAILVFIIVSLLSFFFVIKINPLLNGLGFVILFVIFRLFDVADEYIELKKQEKIDDKKWKDIQRDIIE